MAHFLTLMTINIYKEVTRITNQKRKLIIYGPVLLTRQDLNLFVKVQNEGAFFMAISIEFQIVTPLTHILLTLACVRCEITCKLPLCLE